MDDMLLGQLHGAITMVIMHPGIFQHPLLAWMQGTSYQLTIDQPDGE